MSFVQVTLPLFIGLLTGLLSGTFGIGGGIICTPLSRAWLDLNPKVAVGTTLAIIIPTAISGAVNYWKRDLVATNLIWPCMLPAVCGTVFGSLATIFINEHILMLLVAILIGLTGIDFLTGAGQRLQKYLPSYDIGQAKLSGPALRSARKLGLLVGVTSGLLGVGGGFILIPGFCYLYGASIKQAFGTSLVLIAAIAVPGTIVHFVSGHVNVMLALSMVVGAMAGAWLGSLIALKVKDSWLKKCFAVVLLVMSAYFIYREFQLMHFI